LDGLIAFNEAATGLRGRDRLDLAILLRDAERRTIGGALGNSHYGWVRIELLSLPEALRGQGWGSRLMQAVEDEARARRCLGVRLETLSFQARGFYEKLGYSVIGTLPDYPPGHTLYWLAKRLEEGNA
ncbi:MAG: GNAT family N-acetyltransferase, partial [Roseococcus sp.]|nr:GNAT family N-acetyltransferase [Roseococcus sp.]